MLKLVFEFLVQLWVKVFKYKLCFSYDPIDYKTIHYRKGKHGKYYYTVSKTTRIYENGYLHSLTEPAVKNWNTEYWFKQGKLHKEDGPAFHQKMFSHHYEWYVDGKLHKLDGPACFRIYCGYELPGSYYIDGVHYSKEQEYWNHPKVIEHRIKQIEKL